MRGWVVYYKRFIPTQITKKLKPLLVKVYFIEKIKAGKRSLVRC